MPLFHLPVAQHRAIPWKNGLGISHTIADHPHGAGFDALDWQVSSTQIGADCPFSDLPGIDRQFMVIEGAGVELTCTDEKGGTTVHRADPLRGPLAFRGDWRTSCRLLAGPVRVFNVMTRRGRFAADLSLATGGALQGDAGGTLVAVDLKSLDAWQLDGEGAQALPSGTVAVVRIRKA